jgi:hypothetical protein
MVPVVEPDAWGVKLTVKEILLPEGIVTGSDRPVTENSDPLMSAADTVTGPLLAERLAVWL